MKILSGHLRGAPIEFRASPHLRPTPDKVRRAVIETLAQAIPGASVLDAYAGTGALGFEALSSGAARVDFVEKHGSACAAIRKTAASLKSKTIIRIHCVDVAAALKRFAAAGETFDLILADPPYEQGMAQNFLAECATLGTLKPGGWLLIETYKTEAMPESLGLLTARRHTLYGDTAVHYYAYAK